MRYLDLPGVVPAGGAKMSVLGFGCSALLGRASRTESERAVGAALDAGITFFDTARSYGYGHSEGLLGGLFAGKREQVILCTKFGIVPVAAGWKQKVKPLARAVVKAFPGLRKAAQRQVASEMISGQFSVETLTSSFDTSLRELRTDYVDMLILHAAPVSVLAQDDLLEAMARLVESGKVRMAGISGELPVISAYFKQRPPMLTTAQFALNPSCFDFVAETKQNGDLLLVANHPYGGPGGSAGAKIAALRQDHRLPGELREKLVEGDAQVLPEVVLNCILSESGVSAVVPAMMQVRHIAGNVKALEQCRFTPAELEHLRNALAD
jgi:aryl-alcohol dehydrogenase-like predicted oxidoreductase